MEAISRTLEEWRELIEVKRPYPWDTLFRGAWAQFTARVEHHLRARRAAQFTRKIRSFYANYES